MAIDLKPVVKESDELHLSLEGLSLSKQLSEKQISHTINNPTLDDDPKDFYVKDVDFDAHLQNITLLNQCKKMIERVFYPILNTGAKYMDKTQSSTFDQNLIISSYKEAFSGFNFTELLYNPIEQAQRNDAARGCELINKGNTHANFSSAVDSMGSA
ncbi:hypothetical protein AX774_g5927 [Zancudomyces culisetae]|nr:hypothetical protein AX774_g5927 [Zancudomyces culisetae]|eukprot:OMH80645.1 hypothetical protein AX774_g5927 [Zancudomyces culisetae]